jgi:oligosaccharide repeat unit polymerase
MEVSAVLPLLVAIGLPIAALRAEKWRVTPLLLVLVNLGFVLVGLVVLDSTPWKNVSLLYALSLALLFVGFLLHRSRDDPVAVEGSGLSPVSELTLRLFWVAVVALVAYHFAVGGVPLFSEEIEDARYGFASSGLLGIPGRMYLFGLPVLLFYVTVVRSRSSPTRLRGLWILTWVVFATAQALTGFKSAILTVLFVGLFALTLAGKDLSIVRAMTPKVIALVLAAMAFAVFISFRYQSTGVRSIPESFEYLAERLTVTAAEPPYIVMRELDDEPGFFLVRDTAYYLEKYFGLNPGEDPRFPLDQIVAARIYGIALTEGSFIAPATVTAFGELEADFGPVAALLAMLGLGWTYALLLARAVRSAAPLVSAIWCFAAYMMFLFFVNGNLAYLLINSSAVVIFLALLWAVSHGAATLLNSRTGARPSGES